MENVVTLYKDGSVDAYVPVMNRGLSDIKIEGGTAFFRLYFRPSGGMITGKSLYDTIKEGKLKVEGNYGETWSLIGSHIPHTDEKITGKVLDDMYEMRELKESEIHDALTLKLHLNNNIYVPDNNKGILVKSKKDLVDILQPFDANDPRHMKHNFNIGETANVDFGEYFGSIIYQSYNGGGHHILSPLIDPGFTGPIRTEILKGYEFNKFIELHIYHKDGERIVGKK